MTREEAVFNWGNISGCDATEDWKMQLELIARIYDDFESRTCENCKHSDLLDTDEYACSSEYMIAEFNTYPQYPLIVDSDFGCNKFARKQNEN